MSYTRKLSIDTGARNPVSNKGQSNVNASEGTGSPRAFDGKFDDAAQPGMGLNERNIIFGNTFEVKELVYNITKFLSFKDALNFLSINKANRALLINLINLVHFY